MHKCYVSKCPTGVYSFVGSVPGALCEKHKATSADVMGGRAQHDDGGALVTWRSRLFASETEARAFAAERGVQLAD